MASIALRIRLSSTCWICTLSTRTRSTPVVEVEHARARRARLAPTSAERARFLDQLAQALEPLLGLAMGHEIAQAADDLAGAQRLLGGLVQRVAHLAAQFLGSSIGRAAACEPFEIVGDRRQRLVQLVGQGRGHLAHCGQPRDMRRARTAAPAAAARSRCRSVRSRMKPVKNRGRCRIRISPTASFIGNVEPSLRSPDDDAVRCR